MIRQVVNDMITTKISPDKWTVFILKVGSVHVPGSNRNHEFTQWEKTILDTPTTYILDATPTTEIDIFVLLVDIEYNKKPTILINNPFHDEWYFEDVLSTPRVKYHTCVIAANIMEDEILATFAQLKDIPLSAKVLMSFCNAFSDIEIPDSSVAHHLPGNCFADEKADYFMPVFRKGGGNKLEVVEIDGSEESVIFINLAEVDLELNTLAASNAVTAQFLYKMAKTLSEYRLILKWYIVEKQLNPHMFKAADKIAAAYDKVGFRIGTSKLFPELVESILQRKTHESIDLLIHERVYQILMNFNKINRLSHLHNLVSSVLMIDIPMITHTIEIITQSTYLNTTEGVVFYEIRN